MYVVSIGKYLATFRSSVVIIVLDYCTLEEGPLSFFEMSVNIYQCTRRNVQKTWSFVSLYVSIKRKVLISHVIRYTVTCLEMLMRRSGTETVRCSKHNCGVTENDM
jgi:hypothetical protein